METHQYPSCVADGDLQLGMRLYKPLTKKNGPRAVEWTAGRWAAGPRAVECTVGRWAAGREVGRGLRAAGPRAAFSKTQIAIESTKERM